MPWRQHISAIAAILVISAPILKQVIVHLARKKKERDALLARERAQIDQLRTGQGAPQGPSALERLEQASAQRRAPALPPRPRPPAQRPRPAPVMTAGGRPPPRTTQIRLPGGIVLEIPAEPEPPRPKKARPPRAPRAPRPPAPAPVPTPPPAQAHALSRHEAHELRHAQTEQSAWDAPGAPGPQHGVPLAPLTPSSLRRAIILNEILARPLSLR